MMGGGPFFDYDKSWISLENEGGNNRVLILVQLEQ